eukprot:4572573-Pleurochrysis_carterae.AAC.1
MALRQWRRAGLGAEHARLLCHRSDDANVHARVCERAGALDQHTQTPSHKYAHMHARTLILRKVRTLAPTRTCTYAPADTHTCT